MIIKIKKRIKITEFFFQLSFFGGDLFLVCFRFCHAATYCADRLLRTNAGSPFLHENRSSASNYNDLNLNI